MTASGNQLTLKSDNAIMIDKYLNNNASLTKIRSIELFKKANLQKSSSPDHRAFNHNSKFINLENV